MTPDPTLQPDHGAAGFCTNHAQHAPDERTETVARVLFRRFPASELPFTLWDELPEGVRGRYVASAAAVVAALGDETARLRASADAWWSEYDRELQAHEATKAEVERLSRIVNGYDRAPAEQRAADAEAERDALVATVARVEALFSGGSDTSCRTTQRRDGALSWYDVRRIECVEVPMADLRAALDPEEPR